MGKEGMMKLSKKSATVQRAIHKALASGKALGGLIVGLAATVSGCRDHSPASTMGDYPASPQQQEENAMRNRRASPCGSRRASGAAAGRDERRERVQETQGEPLHGEGACAA